VYRVYESSENVLENSFPIPDSPNTTLDYGIIDFYPLFFQRKKRKKKNLEAFLDI
jgi:hypothetical protein